MNGEGEEEHKASSTGEKMYAWKSQDNIKERKEKYDLVALDPLFCTLPKISRWQSELEKLRQRQVR